MEKINNNKNWYDAIIIGAGNGGLTAALTLAKMDKKVLLVEQNNTPGGFASSFVRGRFEFEVSAHEISDLGVNGKQLGFLGKLFKELELDIEWIEIKDAFKMTLFDENFRTKKEYTMPTGVQNFTNKLEEYIPGSSIIVSKCMKLFEEFKLAIEYLESSKGKPEIKKLKKDFPNFLLYGSYSCQQAYEKLNVPKNIQDLLNLYWPYLGGTPEEISFVFYGIVMHEYLEYGAYIPKNRSHEISMAFLKKINENNGKILLKTKVENIIIENNQVKGIKTSNGTFYSNHIISNVSPKVVYRDLIENSLVPKKATQLINTQKLSPQGFCVYLGLNKSVDELGIKDYSNFFTPTLDASVLINQRKEIKDAPDNVIVLALDVVNPEISNPGTSMLTFTSLYYKNEFDAIEKSSDYFKMKNEIASKYIDFYEKVSGIKIRDSIEEIEVATPITFSHYTGVLNGSIYGFKQSPNLDSVIARAQNLDDVVFIKGLRFCGSFSFRGHGFNTTYISGNIIAKKTYEDMMEGNK